MVNFPYDIGVLGSQRDCKKTFLRTYMARKIFQSILSNLQVSDTNLDHPHNHFFIIHCLKCILLRLQYTLVTCCDEKISLQHTVRLQ